MESWAHHIHHLSLVNRLGFLYYVIGDVYEVYKRKLVELVSKIIDNHYLVRTTILCLETKLAD